MSISYYSPSVQAGGKTLSEDTEVVVRFNEADPLGIVWHGHYLRYFEDGREAFGKVHGISYLDCLRNDVAVPVVSVQCDYANPLRYGVQVWVLPN
jgi:acyl-CoA thioester hydrolase